MKVAITADWQFDSYPRLSRILPSGITTRLQDMLDCWSWVVGDACGRGCTSLVVVGDMFDSRTSIDIPVLHHVCKAVEYASKRLSITILPGNHDSYLRSPAINSLPVFLGTATVVQTPTRRGKHVFVPWFEDASDLELSIVALSSQIMPGDVLFTHAMIRGAVSNSSGIPVEVLHPEKFRRVFLGDVHDPVEVTAKVRYVGSPLQIDYRDAGRTRGYMIYDDAADTVTYVENQVSPRFHHIKSADGEVVSPGARDFVRVSVPDQKAADRITQEVKRTATWVESTSVSPLEDQSPRLKVSAGDDYERTLRMYAEHAGVKDVDEIVQVGLQILASVRE